MSPRAVITVLFPVERWHTNGNTVSRFWLFALIGFAIMAMVEARHAASRGLDRLIVRAAIVERWFTRAAVLVTASLVASMAFRVAAAWWDGRL